MSRRSEMLRLWFELVPSEVNPSDKPSRDLSLATSQWQVAPGCTSSPVGAVFPPFERLSHPHGWMIEANEAAILAFGVTRTGSFTRSRPESSRRPH